jgi:hypothetical protein
MLANTALNLNARPDLSPAATVQAPQVGEPVGSSSVADT